MLSAMRRSRWISLAGKRRGLRAAHHQQASSAAEQIPANHTAASFQRVPALAARSKTTVRPALAGAAALASGTQ